MRSHAARVSMRRVLRSFVDMERSAFGRKNANKEWVRYYRLQEGAYSMVVGPGLAASAMSTNLSGAEVATDVRAPECGIGGPLVCASLGMVDAKRCRTDGNLSCSYHTLNSFSSSSKRMSYAHSPAFYECAKGCLICFCHMHGLEQTQTNTMQASLPHGHK